MEIDSTPLLIVAATVVLGLFLVVARKFDFFRMRLRHGDTEADLGAGRHSHDQRPAGPGSVKARSVENAEIKAHASGDPVPGAGSVEILEDVKGGKISAKFEQK